ncbi:hypothetical protein JR316_0000159 [Psilocybe cubensis]|uniref:Uncharacterized protein n=2 Tax=Psilocybe cubensis TaxID=181762 RepID=A0ACB8HG17_PSICU|nr:hypothetical protein JR316_0000159 [Psilocybe cubensis]KAH9486095.1 hypothetical protein JR316_0000159 [Psilocybe cubensis]
MLAWRAIVRRPATLIRQGPQIPRRSLHSSLPRPQLYQQRGGSLLAKLRFRADGKPRSRLMGATIGTLVLFNILTLATMYDLVEEGEITLGLLVNVIYLQRADMSYSNINLEDSAETLIYFKKLYQAFARIPQEEVDDLFKDLSRMIKAGETEVEAHRIMRTAAEQIHLAFQDLDHDSIASTSNYIFDIMREALENLIDLIPENVDDESDSKYTFQLIRDHSKKDAGAVLKDYESLG